MERLEHILSILDYSLRTKRKRHIVGGVLMSMSLLFGDLAVTIFALKAEYDDDEVQHERLDY